MDIAELALGLVGGGSEGVAVGHVERNRKHVAAAVELLAVAQERAAGDLTTFEIVSREAVGLVLDHAPGARDPFAAAHPWYVLVELAGRVRGQVRDVDTVARYGGEEFVVILPETDEEGAVQAAERIRAAVRRRPFGDAGETPLEVTVSVGVAVFPVHGAGSTALLRRADEALYAAKAGGRDRAVLAGVA